MPFHDDADDESGFVPPLPPDDRLWRHPSERAAARAAEVAVTPAPRRRRSSPRTLVLAVAVLIALMGATALVGLGNAGESVGSATRSASDAAVPSAVSDRLSPAVVRVTAERPDGTWSTTGLMVRSDGHLVTTADPLVGATSITVRVADGSTFNARVVGTDRADDIAVLDIATSDAATAPVTRSSDLASDLANDVSVYVLGRTRDGSQWTAAGSIDARRQRLVANDGSVLLGLLRTVMAESPSVGSAIVCTSDGSVLGILTARTPMMGASSASPSSTLATSGRAISFAVPIAWIMKVTDEIIDTGTFHRAWIGVVSDDTVDGGALVRSVADGGPAARAGIVTGDVIVSIDDAPINGPDDLALGVRALRPGDRVTIGIERDGVASRVAVVISEQT